MLKPAATASWSATTLSIPAGSTSRRHIYGPSLGVGLSVDAGRSGCSHILIETLRGSCRRSSMRTAERAP